MKVMNISLKMNKRKITASFIISFHLKICKAAFFENARKTVDSLKDIMISFTQALFKYHCFIGELKTFASKCPNNVYFAGKGGSIYSVLFRFHVAPIDETKNRLSLHILPKTIGYICI